MKLLNVVMLVFGAIEIVSSEKYATGTTSKLSYTYDPTQEESLLIQKSDVKTLDLSGRIMTKDIRSLLKDYINLEDLTLSNCRIRQLDNGTFADLSKLIKLNLSDNLMKSFNGYSFDEVNVLNILILSNNLLDSLKDFSLDVFPQLRVLDISGNQLQYLPGNIIHKLQNNPAFSLYVSNNPWNCDHPHWKNYLETNVGLRNKFCNSPPNYSRYGDNRTNARVSPVTEHCGFFKCKLWIIGAVWVGVILGNLNKINKLLWQSRCRKKRSADKATGTEMEVHHLLRQERVAAGVEEAEFKSRN